MRRSFMAAAALALVIGMPAHAAGTWDDLRPEIFGDTIPVVDDSIVKLDVPYRTRNDPRTDISAEIRVPLGEFIKTVTLIIDDNPMPVSAVFEMAEPQPAFSFAGTMRVNGPSMVRVVATTATGKLYMQEAFVKTSGVGACSAPPGTDPEMALATLGTMKFKLLTAEDQGDGVLASLRKVSNTDAAVSRPVVDDARMARLDIDHPSHSGMQMDQITLLFIPMRYVETVEVTSDDKPLFTMTGSISFSENPAIRFKVPADAVGVGVKMTDTEGATFEKTFSLSGG